MSGIDLRQYAYVLVVPRLSSGSSTIYLRLNGISDAYYFREASSRKYLVFFQSFAKDCNTLIKLMGMGEGITAISEYVAKSGDGFQDYASMDTNSGVSASTLQALSFMTDDSTVKISAGGKITIYGVKL